MHFVWLDVAEVRAKISVIFFRPSAQRLLIFYKKSIRLAEGLCAFRAPESGRIDFSYGMRVRNAFCVARCGRGAYKSCRYFLSSLRAAMVYLIHV